MKRIIFALTLTAMVVAVTNAFATDVTYTNQIKPIFDSRCSSCHGGDSPEYKVFKQNKKKWVDDGIGPKMDSYTHLVYFTGWPDTGALMRRLDDTKPGNMYQHLGETEEDRQEKLLLFKAWVGEWTTKRFNAVTKEELSGIKVKY